VEEAAAGARATAETGR